MTTAGTSKLREMLLDGAVSELCPVEPSVVAQRRAGVRNAREAKIRHYGGKFLDQMLSDAPFKTEEEAITALAPVAVWFFRWALRQLAIQVIKLLWKRLHEYPQSAVTVVRKAD